MLAHGDAPPLEAPGHELLEHDVEVGAPEAERADARAPREALVRLVPLALEHVAELKVAAADGELWTIRVTSVPEPADTRGYIERALQA